MDEDVIAKGVIDKDKLYYSQLRILEVLRDQALMVNDIPVIDILSRAIHELIELHKAKNV